MFYICKCNIWSYLWYKEIDIFNFLVKKNSIIANFGITSYERYYQTNYDVSFLKVFGCHAFAYL